MSDPVIPRGLLPVVAGDWYFVGKCPTCSQLVPISPVPTAGLRANHPATAECSGGHVHTYSPNQIRCLQAQSSGEWASNGDGQPDQHK